METSLQFYKIWKPKGNIKFPTNFQHGNQLLHRLTRCGNQKETWGFHHDSKWFPSWKPALIQVYKVWKPKGNLRFPTRFQVVSIVETGRLALSKHMETTGFHYGNLFFRPVLHLIFILVENLPLNYSWFLRCIFP